MKLTAPPSRLFSFSASAAESSETKHTRRKLTTGEILHVLRAGLLLRRPFELSVYLRQKFTTDMKPYNMIYYYPKGNTTFQVKEQVVSSPVLRGNSTEQC